MNHAGVTRTLMAAAALLLWVPTAGAQVNQVPPELGEVSVGDRLGERIDLSLKFEDHDGREVRLGDYTADGKPVLLTLNYYSCAMLCTLQLNGLVDALKGLDHAVGDGYRIVTVSFDASEDARLAQAKRRVYLESLGQEDTDWSFLTGDKESIAALTSQLGFGYTYIAEKGEYAHPAVVYSITPDGTISRAIQGIQFPSQDLKFALVEASDGLVGSFLDKVLLTCFHYDSQAGRYTPFAFGVMRLGGGISGLLLLVFLLVLWRRESALGAGNGHRPAEAVS